jgi:hypothetical protein
MIVRAQFACSLFACLAAAACVSAQTWSALSANQSIVVQMARAQAENRSHFHPCTVTREYKLFRGNNRDEAKALVVAEITAVRADSKQYAIDNPGESGFGEKIVRKMLDSEVAFAKDSGSNAITRDNYDFVFVREDEFGGKRCYVLELLPRQNSKNLLRGTIWVDADTYLPYRVEGEPAKSPSWWLKDVHIVLLYGPVGTMWLQTSSEAEANVRILGVSTMVSRDVKYQIGDLVPGALSAQTIVSAGAKTGEGAW